MDNTTNFDHLDTECFTLNNAKNECLDKLRQNKVRLSQQRLKIIDVLFSREFKCTKDLYYELSEDNPNLGISTVYRFLKVLSDLGVISNSKQFNISCANCSFKLASLKDNLGNNVNVSDFDLPELLRLGLVVKGLIKSNEKIDVKMVDDAVHIEVKK